MDFQPVLIAWAALILLGAAMLVVSPFRRQEAYALQLPAEYKPPIAIPGASYFIQAVAAGVAIAGAVYGARAGVREAQKQKNRDKEAQKAGEAYAKQLQLEQVAKGQPATNVTRKPGDPSGFNLSAYLPLVVVGGIAVVAATVLKRK